eukprot:6314040-Amphidinium_carterae.1
MTPCPDQPQSQLLARCHPPNRQTIPKGRVYSPPTGIGSLGKTLGQARPSPRSVTNPEEPMGTRWPCTSRNSLRVNLC